MKFENILATIVSFKVMFLILLYVFRYLSYLNVYSYIIISAILIACFVVVKSVSIEEDKTDFIKLIRVDIPVAYWFVVLAIGIIAITNFILKICSDFGPGTELFWFLTIAMIGILNFCWLGIMLLLVWFLDSIVSGIGKTIKVLL